jgi:hypothetical protein
MPPLYVLEEAFFHELVTKIYRLISGFDILEIRKQPVGEVKTQETVVVQL